MMKNLNSYSTDWIYKLETRYHWNLYWNQLNLILNSADLNEGDRINEVGIGTGLISTYLKRKGFKVTTIDIDKNKTPDIIADITDFDFPEADLYIGFEIFEHIPFDTALSIWGKMAKKKIAQIAISLPYSYKSYFWGEIWMPLLGFRNLHIGRKRKRITAQHHFWELGVNKITEKNIVDAFSNLGYNVTKSYRYRNHHFFLFCDGYK